MWWRIRNAYSVSKNIILAICTGVLITTALVADELAGGYGCDAEELQKTQEKVAASDVEQKRTERRAWEGTSPPSGAVRTASGIPYKVLRPSSDDVSLRVHDIAEVRYAVYNLDGSSFFNVGEQELRVSLLRLPQTWREGLLEMHQGEKRRYWPSQDHGLEHAVGVPEGGLVVDVELVRIQRRPDPPKAPEDLSTPPRDSVRTPSGLAYQIVHGGARNKADTSQPKRVEVHYTAWNPKGELLDSTIVRGRPKRLSLRGAMPGWRESVGLLAEGSKGRFWMPAKLTGIRNNGQKRGPLIFEIELLRVLR